MSTQLSILRQLIFVVSGLKRYDVLRSDASQNESKIIKNEFDGIIFGFLPQLAVSMQKIVWLFHDQKVKECRLLLLIGS